MKKKHAYLIIAHHEFEVLKLLIQAIDDERNDIYIHFDKKIREYPGLNTQLANIYILTDRVDVRWGDLSVIKAEYMLFEAAVRKGVYSYCHLLSGVDMPLRSQDEIHQFFLEHEGKEFIGFYQGNIQAEIDRKVQRYHMFPKHFRLSGGFISLFIKLSRFIGLRVQLMVGIRRNTKINFKKGTQWVSVTQNFVEHLLKQKRQVLKTYHHSFCSDEIFIQTICWNSIFKTSVFDSTSEGRGCMRMIGWKDNKLVDWEDKDYELLLQSDAMFARKFSSKNLEVVRKIMHKIR